MPKNSWDAAFDAARYNPEQAAFTASESVRERASSLGVHEAYDSMRQQSRANHFDVQNGLRINETGATTLNFEDGSRVEAQLAAHGTPTRQQERDGRGTPLPNDSWEQSAGFPGARQTESASARQTDSANHKLPADADRLPHFLTERELQDHRLEASRRQLEVAAFSAFIPRDREVFLENMRTFEARLGTRSLDEVTRTYNALSQMITGEGLTARSLSPENRYALVMDFMRHAADPTNVDQGEFNTCNVTTMQEGVLTFRPSVMAGMLAQASLAGEYRSRDGRVIQLDGNSLVPLANSRNSNEGSNERSYATQVLNHVMVNEITQRSGRFYSQITRTAIHGDTGERLTSGGFTGDEVLHNGRSARQPRVDIRQMGDAMERYGLPGSILFNSQENHGPNVVTFSSAESMEARMRERIAAGTPIILLVRDLRQFPGGGSGVPPEIPHVISITGIRAGGVVSYSNQWGRHGDGEMRIEDLYRSSRPRT